MDGCVLLCHCTVSSCAMDTHLIHNTLFAFCNMCVPAGVGKTSLMVRYVEKRYVRLFVRHATHFDGCFVSASFCISLQRSKLPEDTRRSSCQRNPTCFHAAFLRECRFDQDYVETLGVNFMEKTISTPTADVSVAGSRLAAYSATRTTCRTAQCGPFSTRVCCLRRHPGSFVFSRRVLHTNRNLTLRVATETH